MKTLYVKNVPDVMLEKDLHDMLKRFGHPTRVEICRQQKCAFVDLESDANAITALKELRGRKFNGTLLEFSEADRSKAEILVRVKNKDTGLKNNYGVYAFLRRQGHNS